MRCAVPQKAYEQTLICTKNAVSLPNERQFMFQIQNVDSSCSNNHSCLESRNGSAGALLFPVKESDSAGGRRLGSRSLCKHFAKQGER